jgi:hypothetical protein
LAHRHLLRMNLNDLALAGPGPVFERFRDAMMRAYAVVAGPDPDFTDRVRAAQAIAMLADPVALFAGAPIDVLRASVLHGVHRLLDDDGSLPCADAAYSTVRLTGPAADRPARGARRRRGRPSVMTTTMLETASARTTPEALPRRSPPSSASPAAPSIGTYRRWSNETLMRPLIETPA